MNARRAAGLSLLLVVSACETMPEAPTVLEGVTRVAVFPPLVRDSDTPLVAGGSALEQILSPGEYTTASEFIGAEVRRQLAFAGFEVVPATVVDAAVRGKVPPSANDAATIAKERGVKAAVFFLDVRRWEPDSRLRPRYVLIAMDATIVDPETGAVLWTASRPARPESTSGAITIGDAFAIAGHSAMSALLGTLRPATSPKESEPSPESR